MPLALRDGITAVEEESCRYQGQRAVSISTGRQGVANLGWKSFMQKWGQGHSRVVGTREARGAGFYHPFKKLPVGQWLSFAQIFT